MKSKFEGKLLGYIGISLLMFVIILFSLGIATPWAVCIGIRWYTKHMTIDGHKVVFDGTGSQLFGNYVKWILLIIITIGIYSLWVPIKHIKWVVSHIHLDYAPTPVVDDPFAQPAHAEASVKQPIQQSAPVQAPTFARCPHCGRRIFSQAKQCMHCNAQLHQ